MSGPISAEVFLPPGAFLGGASVPMSHANRPACRGSRGRSPHQSWVRALLLTVSTAILVSCKTAESPTISAARLLDPSAPELHQRAPDVFLARFETSKGAMTIEVHRDWSPNGADRFYNLVRGGYYDGNRFYRVIAGKWAQFGIN